MPSWSFFCLSAVASMLPICSLPTPSTSAERCAFNLPPFLCLHVCLLPALTHGATVAAFTAIPNHHFHGPARRRSIPCILPVTSLSCPHLLTLALNLPSSAAGPPMMSFLPLCHWAICYTHRISPDAFARMYCARAHTTTAQSQCRTSFPLPPQHFTHNACLFFRRLPKKCHQFHNRFKTQRLPSSWG